MWRFQVDAIICVRPALGQSFNSAHPATGNRPANQGLNSVWCQVEFDLIPVIPHQGFPERRSRELVSTSRQACRRGIEPPANISVPSIVVGMGQAWKRAPRAAPGGRSPGHWMFFSIAWHTKVVISIGTPDSLMGSTREDESTDEDNPNEFSRANPC